MVASAYSAPPRLALLDLARGLALIAMVIYHFCWDLSYLRFIGVDVSADPNWVIFARTILSSFLLLVGMGLVLSHGRGVRWPSFWRRQAILVAAALIITIATYVVFPDAFVYFGILHAIALFSLLALPFLRAPFWLVALIAAVILGLGWRYSNEFYNDRLWSWLGFWTIPPLSNDIVPLFPWFGMVLVGTLVARWLLASRFLPTLAAITLTTKPLRALAAIGRWTLLIYLVHQPLMLGVLFPLAHYLRPGAGEQAQEFLQNCRASCHTSGTGPQQCTTYCQCGLTGIVDNDLWEAVNSGRPSQSEAGALDVITQACSALIYAKPQSSIPPNGPMPTQELDE